MDEGIRELLSQLGIHAEIDDDSSVAPSAHEVVVRLRLNDRRYVLLSRRTGPSLALSERELEIAVLIAAGHTTRSAAAHLGISPWTVSTHVRRMFAKLNVNSRGALIASLPAHELRRAPTRPPA